jgi:hypothetical protein
MSTTTQVQGKDEVAAGVSRSEPGGRWSLRPRTVERWPGRAGVLLLLVRRLARCTVLLAGVRRAVCPLLLRLALTRFQRL